MTPAVCDYHTFDQMNACSKKYCFMAKPVRRRDAVQDGAFAAVGIDTQGKQMDDTVLNSFTYLWLKGYTPEVVKIDEVWSAKRSVEEMTAWCTDRAGVYKNLTAEEKNRIRYYKGEDIYMADLNFLAKVCYSLECKIEDLLEYCPPNNENK